MTTQPAWDSVDNYTSDLLALVADLPHPSVDFEWNAFLALLSATASLHDNRLDQNDYREQLRGVVAPRRIGAFVNKAKALGLITETGEWSVSTDVIGRNGGKPSRIYLWTGDPA